MIPIVERIADLVGLKDRDEFDPALIRLISDCLGDQQHSLAIFRPVGEESDLRWMERVRFRSSEAQPVLGAEANHDSDLPPLDSKPLHRNAMETGMLASQALAPGFLTLAPLSAQHEGLGVLEITSERELSVDQHILLASLLRIYHSLQGLLDYGERDTLTNLLNRKTFDAAFLKRTMLGKIPETTDDRRDPPRSNGHWLGVMDIDHFKKVNDNFGHLIGDEVLILVARLMRSTFRFDDLIYRFGGEEFAIIVNCNCEAHAEAAFNRFRVATQEHVFPQVGRITISLGFTALRPGDTPSAAFERADKAVYYAKTHGRNQVCNHAALVASGEVTEVTDTHELEMF